MISRRVIVPFLKGAIISQMDFFPLHVYTGYSFLRSGLSLAQYVALCKKRGQTYCAISDYCSMTGFPELSKMCAKAGMTPIFGMDLPAEGFLFTVLCVDEESYLEMMASLHKQSENLLTIADIRSLEHCKIILDLSSAPLMEAYSSGKEAYARILRELRLPSLILGIPYLPGRLAYRDYIREFLQEYSYDAIAFPHVRYARREDAISLSIVEAIANDTSLLEKKLNGDQWFLDEATVSSYYSEQETHGLSLLAAQLHFTFEKKRGSLPHYPNDLGLDSPTLLERNAREGLARLIPSFGKEYEQRLEMELSVINKMGYADYFLIVADYVHYAKTHGISVGPGRGSGAGSLVSYAIGIVTVDPIQYGLLFERFLNIDRLSMPDIDVDFADTRRDEVAVYLQQKYGFDRVAHIVTMQTLGAKGSLRDIGRVYGYEERHINQLCEALGNGADSLRASYKNNPTFRSLVDSDPYFLEIVSLAAKIEGLPRQAGLHAAGIVLSEKPLDEIVPVLVHPGVGLVAQYEMTHLEDQGVLKMDILGLRNLTLVDHCIDLIAQNQGIHLDYASLPYEDPEGIKLIAQGKTMGLFQLESAGMNRAIATVKPTCFTDVVAIIALFRPGPMANIPSFASRKAGKERIRYLSPKMEPILSETYGIIVYQEQIMGIATALAGFTFAQADVFRRAVSKKDAAKLQGLRESFLQGCAKQGVDSFTAEKVFDLIFKFADYGFNKSHAVSYGKLTCQMAYLKAHYPIEFYCSILDGTGSEDPKFAPLTMEAKSSGYHFALPDINKANIRYLPRGKAIMLPLNAIKGIPGNLCLRIVEEREENGPYKDLFDFALRTKRFGLGLTTFVKLIDSGCFDEFGLTRARLRAGAEPALRYATMMAGDDGNSFLLEMDFPKPEIPNVEGNRMDDLLAERECLGFMVSGSPLEGKKEIIEEEGLHSLTYAQSIVGATTVAAIVSKAKAIVAKSGKRMAFLTLYDGDAIVEAVCFDEVYDKNLALLQKGSFVKARLSKQRDRDGFRLLEVSPL